MKPATIAKLIHLETWTILFTRRYAFLPRRARLAAVNRNE